MKEQLESVFQQTYPNLEIVAIDDASSDTTLSILQHYAQVYNNMKIYVNETNMGPVKTFEKGISLSAGAFISLCDQDDIWDKRKIELLMKEINGYGVVFCDSAFIDEGGNPLNKKISDIKNLANYNNCVPFIIGNCISGHAAVFTSELVLSAMPFPPGIIHDWWLAFVASSRGAVHFVNQPLVQYRQHPGNFIGAIKVKGRNKKIWKEAMAGTRGRIKSFLEICPGSNIEAKIILEKLNKSYRSFSIGNNFLRMMTFY